MAQMIRGGAMVAFLWMCVGMAETPSWLMAQDESAEQFTEARFDSARLFLPAWDCPLRLVL